MVSVKTSCKVLSKFYLSDLHIRNYFTILYIQPFFEEEVETITEGEEAIIDHTIEDHATG